MDQAKRLSILSLVILMAGIGVPGASAQVEDVKTVIVREGQGPRELAQEVLGEPDLWNEILKANQLSAPSDLRPGMKLVIPAGLIRRSSRELAAARTAIQTATDVGAKLFASDNIALAITFHDEAARERKSGNWQNSIRLATESRLLAEKAHLEALEKRNTAADAIISDRSGTVQGKEANEMLWRDLSISSKLFENNRVRTLSNSYAEISFQDQSRIRLNENSQAVIQKMRVDLLNKERDSSVKLEKGAAYALLQSNQKKKKFNLNIPGVKTEINSKSFWVQKEEEVTKIANYEGEITVSSEASSIILEENQGSKIAADGSIGQSKQLLRGTELTAPTNNAILPGGTITLKWKAVSGAQRYQVQVSADYSFTNVVLNRDDITSDSLRLADLQDGAYYWNVAAIDNEGFPSPVSLRGFFYVFSDTDKPFLYVNYPQEQQIFQTDTLHIVGETESDVQLSINGEHTPDFKNHIFRIPHRLQEGVNRINIAASDLSGNESRIVRTVIYAANREVVVEYDHALKQLQPKQFLARGRTLDLRGKTVPLSAVAIELEKNAAQLRTFADTSGNFQMSLLDIPESSQMLLTVMTPAGYSKSDTLWVHVSKEAPSISLTSKIPAISSEDTLRLSGTVENAVKLSYNGVGLSFPDGHFAHTILLTPGENLITLMALDSLGNECVVQNKIMLDKTPPELVDYSLTKKIAALDDIVDVRVKATDVSGLRRTASVDLQAGDMMNSGYLRFNSSTQVYEGSFKFPKGTQEVIKLKTLVLEDYYGNQKVFYPN